MIVSILKSSTSVLNIMFALVNVKKNSLHLFQSVLIQKNLQFYDQCSMKILEKQMHCYTEKYNVLQFKKSGFRSLK